MLDAYTLKKMLPRLVVAVVAIQISWDLCLWLVEFANSLGSGIADIMTAPFGGTSALDLNSILERLTGEWTNEANWAVSVGLVAALVAIVIFAPGLLFLLVLLVISMLISVLVGVGVLMLRNILILACVIFAPLAIVLWILPGTEKYWNFWKNNFTMLLLLFPLIMIIIYAGRIAAYLAGGLGFPGMFDFLFVMVAFFAPYFIILKAFKWGGGLLAAAGGATANIGSKINSPVQGMRRDAYNRSSFAQARRARKSELDRRGVRGFAEGLTGGGVRGRVNRALLTGVGKPKTEAELKGKVVQSAEAQVEKNFQEDVEAARVGLVSNGRAIQTKGGDWDQYYQKVGEVDNDDVSTQSYIDNKTGKEITIGPVSDVQRYAARKQAAILGAQTNLRYHESLHSRMKDPDSGMSQEEREFTSKFFQDNVELLMPKMPHLYTGVSAAADTNPGSFGKYHSVEDEAILSNIARDINDPAKAGDKAKNETTLLTFTQSYKEAAENPHIQIDPGTHRVMKAFLDPEGGADFKSDINNDSKIGRSVQGLPVLQSVDELDLSPETRKTLEGYKVSVAENIHPKTGSYTPATSHSSSPAPAVTPWTPDTGNEVGPPASRPTTGTGPSASGVGFATPGPAVAGTTPAHPRMYPSEGGARMSPDNLSSAVGPVQQSSDAAVTQQAGDFRVAGKIIGKEAAKYMGAEAEQAGQQGGNTYIINEGNRGEVVTKLTHVQESPSGWSRGPEQTPEPTNEALRPAPGTTYTPVEGTETRVDEAPPSTPPDLDKK